MLGSDRSVQLSGKSIFHSYETALSSIRTHNTRPVSDNCRFTLQPVTKATCDEVFPDITLLFGTHLMSVIFSHMKDAKMEKMSQEN